MKLERLYVSKRAKADRKPAFYVPDVDHRATPLLNQRGLSRTDPYSGVPWEAPALLHDLLTNERPERWTIPAYYRVFPRMSV